MTSAAWSRPASRGLHPNRVARLALLDLALPGLGLGQAMDPANGGLWHFGLFMQPEIPTMLIAGHEDEFFRWWFSDPAGSPDALWANLVAEYTRAYTGRERLETSFGHYRTLLDDGEVNRAWADRDRGTLPMPVLAACGERSARAQLADALRAVAPQVEGHVVAGAGHFVIEERPEELLALLQDFLRDRGASRAVRRIRRRGRPLGVHWRPPSTPGAACTNAQKILAARQTARGSTST